MSRRKRLERTPNGAPIREKLLVQAMELLANDGFDRFNVQRVLDGAGVSRATLYRHFPDVDGLIEAAMVEIFRQQIDLNLRAARELVELSTDKEMFRDGIGRLLEALSKTPAQVRILRAHTVVLGTSRPELGKAVATVQESLNDGWEEVVRSAQMRGLVRKDVDPRTVGVLVQSLSLGRIIDEVAVKHMGDTNWAKAIFDVLDRAFFTEAI
jgi:AcrR family transcriptional regulator